MSAYNHPSSNRFSDCERERTTKLGPIEGYNKEKLGTIEYAIEPLLKIIPRLENNVKAAKDRAENASDGLTVDQSAAIALYTWEWSEKDESLFFILNTYLRSEDRANLKVWFRYLKLLLSALARLRACQEPSTVCVYRGVKFNDNSFLKTYLEGKELTWWGFSSCSMDRDVSEGINFYADGTFKVIFEIVTYNGINIHAHSFFRREKEVLLLPGTFLKVVRIENVANSYTIHLEEAPSPFQVLEDFPMHRKSSTVGRLFNMFKRSDPGDESTRSLDDSEHGGKNLAMIHFENLNNRKSAVITGSKFNDQNMKATMEKIVRSGCKSVYFRENAFTDNAIQILAENLGTTMLIDSLFITKNNLSKMAVQYLTDALSDPSSTHLNELSLVENNLGDVGAVCIANMLTKNRSLVKLSLKINRIEDLGFRAIMKSLTDRNAHLQELSLDWNKFGDQESVKCVLEMFSVNKSLTTFNLSKCKFDNAAIRKIKVAAQSKSNLKINI